MVDEDLACCGRTCARCVQHVDSQRPRPYVAFFRIHRFATICANHWYWYNSYKNDSLNPQTNELTLMHKILSNILKAEMMQILLQKPVHTVGVVASIACVGVGYNFSTTVIEGRLSNIRTNEEERLSHIRTDEQKRKTDEECDGFKRRVPRPLRWLYRVDQVWYSPASWSWNSAIVNHYMGYMLFPKHV